MPSYRKVVIIFVVVSFSFSAFAATRLLRRPSENRDHNTPGNVAFCLLEQYFQHNRFSGWPQANSVVRSTNGGLCGSIP
jgi:hypothetical protein